MVICPSCGSSRIRNDYKPAPFFLRILGIRGLLCDNCNYPFRAFSLLPPKNRRPQHHKHKADVFNSAPVVDLARIRQSQPAETPELRLVTPPQERLEFVVSASSPTSAQVRIVTDHIAPARTDLRTEVTRIHAQGLKEREPRNGKSPKQTAQSVETASSQICPGCGSRNVKRRHRNLLERTLLSFSAHKAYTCRNCSTSFYAKGENHESHPSAIG